MTAARSMLALVLALAACDGPGASDGGAGGSDAGVDGGRAGGDAGEANDAGHDAGVTDAGPCGMACAAPTPLCDEDARACVECLAHADCPGAGASRCEGGACVPCETSAECAHVEGLPRCDAGTCVQCTVATEESDCGANACDPVALACTATPRGSLQTCFACLADSECMDGRRCVELSYMSAPRGYYCMPTPPGSGCVVHAAPYRVALTSRTSRSGEPSATYCGINEMLTTCEAVVAALTGVGAGCTVGDTAACPEGGRCASTPGGNRPGARPRRAAARPA